jgi:hypothetical protein
MIYEKSDSSRTKRTRMLGWRVASIKQGERARTPLQGNGTYANKLWFQRRAGEQ